LFARTIEILGQLRKISAHEAEHRTEQLHQDALVAAALAHALQPLPVELTIDGRRIRDRFLLVEIMNIRRVGPGVELVRRAQVSDGYFDLVQATERERWLLARVLAARLAETKRPRQLRSRRVRSVTLKTPKCGVRIDDKVIAVPDDTHVGIAIQPGALQIVLPGRGRL
jgi:diacylglycerol kinase family enzyme